MNFYLFLIQNGIPGHATRTTIKIIIKRNVRVIQWFMFNFDLNPIKTVWNEMKIWIQKNYGEKFNYDQFRGIVNAVWEHISNEFFNDSVDIFAGSLRSSYSNKRYAYGVLIVLNM